MEEQIDKKLDSLNIASEKESYFKIFRENIIGIDQKISTPDHKSIPITYTDWTASGRNYRPIEDIIINEIMPFVANTHTDTNSTGMSTTYAYHKAQQTIKELVNANANDVLISNCSGMTGVVNKFQRILGLKVHEKFLSKIESDTFEKPIVFITHMEHHSNQTSWLETIADVEIIPPGTDGLVSLENFKTCIEKYKNRPLKIAAITSCSNVTGIMTPYHSMAKIIHDYGGLCFVDFACSAPYVEIDMHPEIEDEYLDAIYFSPHKFLGGPGSSGILIFNKNLYKNTVPDNPGGGTVDWTNPWGGHKFIDDIEAREDGGTPAFIQTIRAALCMQLKEKMGVANIKKREDELIEMIWDGLLNIPNLHILADQHKNRIGIFSFYIDGLHYTAGVKLLNDKFGIQTRGGCSCAGTYGHYLLNVTEDISNEITGLISRGDCSSKPGWIRMSIHPTNTNAEIKYVIESIQKLAKEHQIWLQDYDFDIRNNRIKPKQNSCESEVIQRINTCLSKSHL
ncbi:MAG: aminotransferase class V-fold PLP-dependent enzyme [Bacteroidia bacterium]